MVYMYMLYSSRYSQSGLSFPIFHEFSFVCTEHIMKEARSAFKILTGKPTGKRPLERPRRRWEDLQEIGINAGNWVDSTQDRNY